LCRAKGPALLIRRNSSLGVRNGQAEALSSSCKHEKRGSKGANTPETLMKRADQALYKAKILGRNRAEPADWGIGGSTFAPTLTEGSFEPSV
jgi:hypothetical protein